VEVAPSRLPEKKRGKEEKKRKKITTLGRWIGKEKGKSMNGINLRIRWLEIEMLRILGNSPFSPG
jgi:hypothetical protein